MVLVRSATAAFEDFEVHRAGDDVARCKVFRGRSISFHEAFAFAVEKISAFAASAFCDQDLKPLSVRKSCGVVALHERTPAP